MSKKTKLRSLPPALDGLIDDGWIEEVVSLVKSGKEATVYCCRACESLGMGEYAAAKYYRPRESRSFKDDTLYQEGRVILSPRARRAVAKRTDFGKAVQQSLWMGAEYETLQILHAAGASVPRPNTLADDVLLMEYVGDGRIPGRPLYSTILGRAAARDALDLLLDNIALWLRHHRIHGDLSPFNILHTESRGITVIDVPQAVDPRQSPHAHMLLQRDLANVLGYFEGHGARLDPTRHAAWLWNEWKMGRL